MLKKRKEDSLSSESGSSLKKSLQEKYASLILRNKILIPTLAVLFLSFLVFTIYLISDQRRKSEALLDSKAETVIHLLTYSNISNVWDYNITSLKTNCSAFFKDEEIIKITVEDSSGDVLVNYSRKLKGSKEITKTSKLIRENTEIGKATVVFTNYYIEENLSAIRNKFIIMTIVIFALISALISFLSNFALLPLAGLMEGIRHLKEGKLDYKIKVNSRDELGKLANSFNDMSAELLTFRDNLEGLVEKRTEELRQANEKLSQTMDALWGEMELAKKIQTSLLPKTPDLKGYEIMASLEPADDVGGDYYDVITVNGYDWIVIGDVSGHGVPAGLIMMMVQTSIHTVLNDEANITPSHLLTTINKTITNNISKLGESKYMTMTVLAAMKDGKFFFSGLHQDILIYRASTGTVDIVETRGMWIGIALDITEMLDVDSLDIGIGDTMILYTDGITEALDASGKMYESQRLYDTIKNNGMKSAKELHRLILEDLSKYIKNDDVTLVIIKRISE